MEMNVLCLGCSLQLLACVVLVSMNTHMHRALPRHRKEKEK